MTVWVEFLQDRLSEFSECCCEKLIDRILVKICAVFALGELYDLFFFSLVAHLVHLEVSYVLFKSSFSSDRVMVCRMSCQFQSNKGVFDTFGF